MPPKTLDTTNAIRYSLQFQPEFTISSVWINLPKITNVIYNDPATIVTWNDNTKTVVKCQPNDTYSEEIGLAMCIAKKAYGNKGNYNDVFNKWLPQKEVKINAAETKLFRFKIINKYEFTGTIEKQEGFILASNEKKARIKLREKACFLNSAEIFISDIDNIIFYKEEISK